MIRRSTPSHVRPGDVRPGGPRRTAAALFGLCGLLTVGLALLGPSLATATGTVPPPSGPRHGLSVFGDLKYPADFTHFEYVDPAAPKGGRKSLIGSTAITTYDSFNPFILKGNAAQGMDLVFDALMVRAFDELDAVYGLVAETAEVAPDRMSVTFRLRKEGRFADGTPVTADDVVFTFAQLKDPQKSHPRFSIVLQDVAGAEAVDPHTVRYTFVGQNVRDLPIEVALLPVLSKAYYTAKPFEQSLDPPVGSGPYRIADFRPGASVTYQRREDYWARDLPVNRGRYNFDVIRFDYFRDRTIELQNLLNGTYDFREEFTSKDWALGYDVPAVREARIIRKTTPDARPSGTQGFFLNTRRAKFADWRVRRALDVAFDYEWANKNLFYGIYDRTTSYFENSEMEAKGPPSAEELALLEPFRAKLPAEVFGEPYLPPVTDGTGGDERKFLRDASQLLEAAGFTVKNGKRVTATGEPFEIEFLTQEQGFDRVIQPYIARLQKLGITAAIRRVDPAQYQQRMKTFDFDTTISRYVMRTTPGVELRNYFSSAAAVVDGSFNLAGVKDPVVDALVDAAMNAKTRADLVVATRALDRVLRAGNYWVSHWYKGVHHMAFWNRYSWPAVKPKYDRASIDTWWYDAAKSAAIKTN
jgi:microcin C transport system substrate-binding protein